MVMDVVEKQPLIHTMLSGLTKRPSWAFIILLSTILAIFTFQTITPRSFLHPIMVSSSDNDQQKPSLPTCVGFYKEIQMAGETTSLTEFGGVGDGVTSNTAAFRKAIGYLKKKGGGKLTVPQGRWLTGSFNLTSNFTLFLEEGAVLLGSQDPSEWPIVDPLPSYGRGRERLGGRHISLIHGDGLTNVVITGKNGTIDGQGKMWWDLWWNRTLEHTRGHLVELINSHNVLISNLTFLNSPFWTIHPVYCSNVVIKDMTILAPLNAPNTDGIDPDSSSNVCIEDCYIESGDDLVAVKSGWDQYGISFAHPSSNVIVRRVSGTTPTCSGVGVGSEMSGGISNVIIEGLYVRDSAAGIRIKTDMGRGGYIANITITNIIMERVKVPIRFSRGSNDHPDKGWDPNAIPKVKGIFISNVVSFNSRKGPILQGIEGSPFESICLRNVSFHGLTSSLAWQCEFVSGYADDVSPMSCPQLQKNSSSLLCSEF